MCTSVQFAPLAPSELLGASVWQSVRLVVMLSFVVAHHGPVPKVAEEKRDDSQFIPGYGFDPANTTKLCTRLQRQPTPDHEFPMAITCIPVVPACVGTPSPGSSTATQLRVSAWFFAPTNSFPFSTANRLILCGGNNVVSKVASNPCNKTETSSESELGVKSVTTVVVPLVPEHVVL